MYRIVVNDADVAAETPSKSWGELLDWLDARCAEQGRVVTGARLDGVEWPAFRGADDAARPLDDVAVVEVEAVTPRDLLASTLEQGMEAARSLGAAAERIGSAFRGVDVSAANRDLAEFAQTLGTLVTITQTLAGAMSVGLDEVTSDGVTGDRFVEELTAHAEAVIAAQQQRDWITVADIVEYDIAPALGRWPGLFAALATRLPPVVA